MTRKELVFIITIILLALALRLINLDQSLWLDEAVNVVDAKKTTFGRFLTEYPLGDFHPPLYFAFLWVLVRVFGDSELVVRMPSVIFGILNVLVVF